MLLLLGGCDIPSCAPSSEFLLQQQNSRVSLIKLRLRVTGFVDCGFFVNFKYRVQLTRRGIRKFQEDLHPLLGFERNERRDAMTRKFDTIAEKRLLRGKVTRCICSSLVCGKLYRFPSRSFADSK